MRWKALVVLLAVLIGVVVPPSLPLLTASGVEASIGTLDVCHNATPALYSHGNMPCMSECTCQHLPMASIGVPYTVASAFTPLLLPFQFERPPQV